MSSNVHAKVNPFYIQDDEDDENSWDDDEYNDYDDEQVMLMSGNANNNNRKYSVSTAFPNNSGLRQSAFEATSYHDGRYERHQSYRQHTPQYWKYGLILVTIILIVIGPSSISSDRNNNGGADFVSLIDEIPNDEYRIVVLGERHSGTTWMRDRLQECFPHVEVSTHLQRSGYFFQDDEATALSKEQSDSQTNKKANNSNRDAIVVHMTLNVYDWLEQMRLIPEYAPNHVGKHQELGHPIPLEWEEFLSRPWTTERTSKEKIADYRTSVCQMGFYYHEVVRCFPESGIGDPMYELQQDGDGNPFQSLIELRAAKLQNHRNVIESWPSVKKLISIKYETTAQTFQSQLLKEILTFTGWNDGRYDDPKLPCSGNVLPPSLDLSNAMTLEFVDYVTDHVDWKVEESVASYVPWNEADIAAKGIRSVENNKANNSSDSSKQTQQTPKAKNNDNQKEKDLEKENEDLENFSEHLSKEPSEKSLEKKRDERKEDKGSTGGSSSTDIGNSKKEGQTNDVNKAKNEQTADDVKVTPTNGSSGNSERNDNKKEPPNDNNKANNEKIADTPTNGSSGSSKNIAENEKIEKGSSSSVAAEKKDKPKGTASGKTKKEVKTSPSNNPDPKDSITVSKSKENGDVLSLSSKDADADSDSKENKSPPKTSHEAKNEKSKNRSGIIDDSSKTENSGDSSNKNATKKDATKESESNEVSDEDINESSDASYDKRKSKDEGKTQKSSNNSNEKSEVENRNDGKKKESESEPADNKQKESHNDRGKSEGKGDGNGAK